jgi:hypothetical protein
MRERERESERGEKRKSEATNELEFEKLLQRL